VIHPFHPLRGRTIGLVTIKKAWGEQRVHFISDLGEVKYLPAHWTDAIPPDPFVAVSAGRAHCRIDDLLEIVQLVQALKK
jgi:hypothetical protein